VIDVGRELEPLEVPAVSASAMHEMAKILDDPNEIHLDAAAVAALGLGNRTINQGPTNCGYVLNMLRNAFPGGELRSFRVRFLGNVFADDHLVARGVVTSVTDGVVGCDVWLERNGERLLDGSATILVAS